jgi:hypothetical protein
MKNIENASEQTLKVFTKVRINTSIPQWVEFEVLSNNKQKQLYKIAKLSEVSEFILNENLSNNLNFSIVINEEIFDGLTEEQKEMVFEECLTGVVVNQDNDKLSLKKPTFNTYFGILKKYGNDTTVVLHESIKSLFDNKKAKDDQIKAETEKVKAKKFRG